MKYIPKMKKQLGATEDTIYGVSMILGARIYTVICESIGLAGGSIVFSFKPR